MNLLKNLLNIEDSWDRFLNIEDSWDRFLCEDVRGSRGDVRDNGCSFQGEGTPQNCVPGVNEEGASRRFLRRWKPGRRSEAVGEDRDL